MASQMEFGKLHHVGVAVHDLRQAAEGLCRLFGATTESQVYHDANQGVRLMFVNMGGLRYELLEPAANPSPLDSVLRRGISIYHAGYEVANMDARLAELLAKGATMVSPPKPAVAFGGRRVAFVMWHGLMVELIDTAA